MKINFNTQITVELANALAMYLKANPGLSKAQATEDAIKEYLEKRVK